MTRLCAAALLYSALHFCTGVTASAQAQTPCATQLRPNWSASSVHRAVTTRDIATLLDIGQPTSGSALDPAPFALSPDGRHLAFVMRRADPRSNSYCQGLFLLDVDSGKARLLDSGGDLIRSEIFNLRGLRTASGVHELILPSWSPDGRTLAYRRQEAGIIQVWRAAADGSRAGPVTHSRVNIERFNWVGDDRIIFASSQPLEDWKARTKEEALGGYRYDRRFMPIASASIPLAPAGLGADYGSIDLHSGNVGAATSEEVARLDVPRADGFPAEAVRSTRRQQGGGAWLAREIAENPGSPLRLHARIGDASPILCEAEACKSLILDMWWDEAHDSLLFLTLSGWGNSVTSLYRWNGTKAAPVNLMETTDLLPGCLWSGRSLICAHENARNPRTIIAIDPATGRMAPLFDPNPGFQRLTRGKVERLQWANAVGLRAFGHLLLPPDHRQGQRHPLLVVQYSGKGFMRGGVGDEYPIHPFAARGYAVLMVQRPGFYSDTQYDPAWRSRQDAVTIDTKDWADRRSTVSSLMTGIGMAKARGVVDPDKIGLTGMSDGAATAMFALISHPRFFKAAGLTTCCQDPGTDLVMAGPAWEESRRQIGYPSYTKAREFFRPISLAMNAASIRTPLLLQLSSDEAAMAFETYVTFRDVHNPLDLYVFPDEHHVKWQPAHRLAVYERNLDWFDFWMRDRIDPAPAKVAQYGHWRALRDAAPADQPTP